jgi:CheY-like chemotaxis protein
MTREQGGIGLGLSIVKHLVELHGGRISAHSDGVGLGALFTVTIPVAPVRAVAPRHPLASGDADTDSRPPSLDGLHVLVVEDERDSRDLLQQILEGSGIRVTLAANAEEGFAALRAKPPDVLLCDIGMPHEDGHSLMKRIRALPATLGGRVSAVALTAYARGEDRTRALTSGFNMHVAKPIDPDELLTVLASFGGRITPA